jgi:hypothetical protein
VGLKEGVVLVRDERLAQTTLARWPLPSIKRGPLDLSLRWTNQRLMLRVNGQVFPMIECPNTELAGQGIIGFYLQDRVRGAAQARGVDLDISALPEIPGSGI